MPDMKPLFPIAAGLALVTALVPLALVPAVATPPPPHGVVTIANDAFAPAVVHVRAGEKVTFVNGDDETHTVTSDTAVFDSGRLDENQRYAYTFTKPGTYAYHCTIHTFMKGTIVVDAAEMKK
jgi:plastocyanin